MRQIEIINITFFKYIYWLFSNFNDCPFNKL